MVVIDKDYTYAWSKSEAELFAKRLHTSARKVEVKTIVKSVTTGPWPKPGTYMIISYY